ncbi:hypothetical protein OF83DRAFT_1293481 [Amylostereum chailletii]|nr:hypothetical protein OF83DRAFT_1293481 [Amylostereum chailletii]
MAIFCDGCGAGPYKSTRALDGHEATCTAAKDSGDLKKILKRTRKEDKESKTERKRRKKARVEELEPGEQAMAGPSQSTPGIDVDMQEFELMDPDIAPPNALADEHGQTSARDELATTSQRSGRRVRLTSRYTDFLPTNHTPLRHMPLSRRQELARQRENPQDQPAPLPPSSPPPEFEEEPVDTSRDGWIKSSVTIPLPCEGQEHPSEGEAPTFAVDGLYHRRLLDVITQVFESGTAKTLHTTPFQQHWLPDEEGGPTERVYSQMYNSDAMLEAHEAVQKLPLEPGEADVERVVVAVMSGSDATHLANFGTASLWPGYTMLGNESKYTLLKPTSGSCHHTMYVPKLGDDFVDAYTEIYGRPPSAAVLTHCKRELMHGVWTVLLDDDLMHAYEHGILVHCGDGILRRLFPRFFTYTADYPEKVLLASIKYLGACPCPRCLIKKEDIHKVGTKNDIKFREKHPRVDNDWHAKAIDEARKLIFEQGVPVNSVKINRKLQYSTVPIRNAFSRVFRPLGANFYEMFVPDILHEFDLGVWKSIFVHLMRLLYAIGEDGIQDLNKRYRQCALPVFEGLFPGQDNKIVQDMLFDLAAWQSYAKLRLHTDTTLQHFEDNTKDVGQSVRKFMSKTCETYVTFELPQETGARGRRSAALTAKTGITRAVMKKVKRLNFNTSKAHTLPDCPLAVRRFGTNEGYSTQRTELEHRSSKRWYSRTNKQNWVGQIANHERRARFMAAIHSRYQTSQKTDRTALPRKDRHSRFKKSDKLSKTSPTAHYHISNSPKEWVNMTELCYDNRDDPAVEDFVKNLQDHLLGRLLGKSFDGDMVDYSNEDRDTVKIRNGRLFVHQTLRVNYTSYDVRRGQDSINPDSRADIMVLASKADAEATGHPYWYARTVRVFSMSVRHDDPTAKPRDWQTMDVCFVRWFKFNTKVRSGWKAKHLPCISFVSHNDAECPAFGFIDPDQIIRATHLIPGYKHGPTLDLLPTPSLARHEREEDTDWARFYVGMQVYFPNAYLDYLTLGSSIGGVGHRGTRKYTLGETRVEGDESIEDDGTGEEEVDGNEIEIEVEADAEQELGVEEVEGGVIEGEREDVEQEEEEEEEAEAEAEAEAEEAEGDDIEEGEDEEDERLDGSGDEDEEILKEAGFGAY